jgi:pyruvate kinase
VVVGGRITERRGVATPGKSPSNDFPDSRAKSALEFAADQDADFVALSTIGCAEDVERARDILRASSCNAHIISKIERSEALENLDSILGVSDGIMVARGDMAVDVPLARVPLIQKDIISRSNAAGKPVITATQMLESMVKTPVPTRAEVTDVANAVFDGTDAIMLSGETSVGKHPVQAVKVMVQVAKEAEFALPYKSIINNKALEVGDKTDDAISYDACRTAYQIDASLIVAFTESGGTAARVSKYRPMVPVLALTQDPNVQRKLVLYWGVTPVIVDSLSNVDGFFEEGEKQARLYASLEPGSLIILVAGLPIGVPGGTNLLRVMTVS